MSRTDPLDIFRTEAAELLEQIEQGLLDLEHRLDDRSLIDAVFRGLHTLKDRKSTRLNSSHIPLSRMPSSA